MRLASRVLAHGLPYVGADFRFDPPVLEPFPLPSIGIVGTGKRVGKTAITARSGAAARARPQGRRRLDGPRRAAGAGGRRGRARRRRAPRALAGRSARRVRLPRDRRAQRRPDDRLPPLRRRPRRRRLRLERRRRAQRSPSSCEPDLVLFDASGAALPPVETRRRVLVVNARQDHEVVTGYLNAYRHLLSDLVVLTMADEGSGWEELRDRIAELGPRVVGVDAAAAAVAARRGPARRVLHDGGRCGARRLRRHLADEHGADVVHVSGNLADRQALRGGARARRCRRLPRRAEGGGDRRRRRGGAPSAGSTSCSRAATSRARASSTSTTSCCALADEATA